jgi:hypothetical protein
MIVRWSSFLPPTVTPLHSSVGECTGERRRTGEHARGASTKIVAFVDQGVKRLVDGINQT